MRVVARLPALGYRLGMHFTLNSQLAIEAPAARVWQVIVDLPRYAEWNPFVVAARSTLVVGAPILMWVQIAPFMSQPQRERIVECVPEERLAWGIGGGRLSPLDSRRVHQLRAAGPHRTDYRSEFELSGPLVGVVRGLLGRRLAWGFEASTAALKQRAEQLEREAAGG